MSDTKDAAQVLRDAGWLVVEPGKHHLFDQKVLDGGALWHGYVVPNDCQAAMVFVVPKPPTETPDTIDWSHVDPKYRYMARDEDGQPCLYTSKPGIIGRAWAGGGCFWADVLSSYRRGTVPWDKSLVCREDEE